MSLADRGTRFSKCCFLEGGSALRVIPAETRLTVYRRLKVREHCSSGAAKQSGSYLDTLAACRLPAHRSAGVVLGLDKVP